MAILVVGYSVEWTKDRTLASQFLAQVREVHEEANAPCTLYLLGEVILAHRKALESLAENPLFDLQITVSKPLKSVCQVVQGQTTVWRGATLEQIDEEVSRCRSLFNEHFGRPPQGISSPLGFYRGLQDRPDILEVLDRHGIRFCRTYARNEQDWQPVEFSVEPFWYTSQGFSHILEFPGQGWQEAIIRRIYGWDDTDGYLEYVKADANDVARREELVWSYWRTIGPSCRARPTCPTSADCCGMPGKSASRS